MKKVIASLAVILLIIFNSFVFLNASSDHIKDQKLIEEENLNENLNYKYYQMNTSFDKDVEKVKRDVYTYTLKPDENTKLAVWTYASGKKYSTATLVALAENYEKEHPGWIVLGGINAEGFYNNEPTNAIIQDGEVIRKDVSHEAFKELIGFRADGSYVIKQCPTASPYPILNVDDKKYEVTKVNELPLDNEIAVILPSMISTIDVSNYNVFKVEYSMYRTSSQFPGGGMPLTGDFLGFFFKGEIVSKVSDNTITTPSGGEIYIVTKNQDLSNKLTINKHVLCQFEYTDEFSDVECMTGYMYKYVENGVTIPVDFVDTNSRGEKVKYNCDYYKTISKERAGIGFKDDGSIVLLTTNTKTGGPTQFEVGEMFREFGCNNAYQFDGGGSVSFVKRDKYGKFEMLNTPGDGHARQIMTGLFIVTRDSGLKFDEELATSTSITLFKKANSFTAQLSNLKVIINEKTYDFNDSSLTINGLKENTEYNLKVTYELDGKTYETSLYAATKKYEPSIEVSPYLGGFEIIATSPDPVVELSKIFVNINGEEYVLDCNKQSKHIIDGLLKDTGYEIEISYTAINTLTNEEILGKFASKIYKTLEYEKPVLKEFYISEYKSNTYINYEFSDPDNIIKSAYIVTSKQYIPLDLTNTSGRILLEELNRYIDQKVEFSMTVTLKDLNLVISDEIIIEKIEHTHNWKDADCYNPKTCTICGEQEGSHLEHDFAPATKKSPKTCTLCGLTEGEKLKGCKKKTSVSIIISLISSISLLSIILKKH